MGNIMISVDDEKEMEIRRYVQEVEGGKKGSLSEFVWKAIASYIEGINRQRSRQVAVVRMLDRMKSARKLGILNKEGKAYSSRDELYADRAIKVSRH